MSASNISNSHSSVNTSPTNQLEYIQVADDALATEQHKPVTPLLFQDSLIVIYICVIAYVLLKKMWNEVVD